MNTVTNSERPAGGPVRVLFLNSRSALGADVAVHLSLARNFDPAKVDVFFATNRNSVDFDATIRHLAKLPEDRLIVADLGHEVSPGGGGPLARPARLARNLPALATLVRLAALIRRQKIDIVHSTDRPRDALFAAILTRLTGCRNVLHAHINWNGGFGRATNWAMAGCTAVLTVSEFSRQSFEKGGIPAAKLRMSRNATDTGYFDPSKTAVGKFRAQLGLTNSEPLIGIVARIMVWKGHMELVEALVKVRAALPDLRLAIIGQADLLAAGGAPSFAGELQNRIQALGLEDNVHWAGWCDNMPEVLNDLDVVAMPSWEEPFGLAVTEAMAMEKPVVGYASGALPEILTDGVEGRLVPPKDIDALASALIDVLKAPDLGRQMGKLGRQRVIHCFSPKRQADEVAEIYRSLLKNTH